MLKSFRPRIPTDDRGKIKTGKKREGTGLPQSLDYFNIEAFPELVAAYGNKPQRLILLFPTDEVSDFFRADYAHWVGGKEDKVGTKSRTCDGETCIHRMKETVNGITYAAGQETPCICKELPEKVMNKRGDREINNPDRCRVDCYLTAWVVNPKLGIPENPKCFLFETHSENSASAIFQGLKLVWTLNNHILRMVPFVLSVKMVGGKEDAKQKYPVWDLKPWDTLTRQMRERTQLLSEGKGREETFDLRLLDAPDGAIVHREEGTPSRSDGFFTDSGDINESAFPVWTEIPEGQKTGDYVFVERLMKSAKSVEELKAAKKNANGRLTRLKGAEAQNINFLYQSRQQEFEA